MTVVMPKKSHFLVLVVFAEQSPCIWDGGIYAVKGSLRAVDVAQQCRFACCLCPKSCFFRLVSYSHEDIYADTGIR